MTAFDRDRCTCGLESRVAEAKVRDEVALAEANRRPFSLWSPSIRPWHFAGCPALGDYPLAPLGVHDKCPKCATPDLRTVWHEGGRWYFTRHPHDFWRDDLRTWQCLLTDQFRPVEHLDRTCKVCGFAWLERVAEPAA